MKYDTLILILRAYLHAIIDASLGCINANNVCRAIIASSELETQRLLQVNLMGAEASHVLLLGHLDTITTAA